jgi:hypothetical protein
MRLVGLLFFVGCTNSTVTVDQAPLRESAPPPVAAAPAPVQAATGDQLLADYLDAVCTLHARPDCAASRTTTCDDGLVLSDPATCQDLLASTARACPALRSTLQRHSADVAACSAWLRSATCEEQPACSPEGPRDAQGPCSVVVAHIRTACAGVEDPG